MTGETGFNEVIFENLEVDDAYRLGEVGTGWQVAMTTLAHERNAGEMVTPSSGGQGHTKGKKKDAGFGSGALIDLARASARNGASAADDPVIRDRIMQELIRAEGFKQNGRRARVAGLLDHPMRLPLQDKLVSSELAQNISGFAMEIAGPAASLYLADNAAPAGGRWPLAYMNSYGMTIAAGTSEVQRNILGERVLDLPKSK
jgi:alkylation response protein AidB-like acyl-CoA dehydrogenase